jgi:LysM repeat protein
VDRASQRRLCLVDAHRDCPRLLAVAGATTGGPVGEAEPDTTVAPEVDDDGPSRAPAFDLQPLQWAFAQTVPVVLDDRRRILPRLTGGGRTAQQFTLAALMLGAVGVIGVTRLSSGPEGPNEPGTAIVSPSTSPSPSSTPPRVAASPTLPPTLGGTPSPATPSPTPKQRTYRVRSGDTLIAIAARFGTTVKALRELNDIGDPTLLRVGQRLVIPSSASEP